MSAGFIRSQHPFPWFLSRSTESGLRSKCRFSRVVDDLKAVSFLEGQVVRRARLVVVQGHEEGDAA